MKKPGFANDTQHYLPLIGIFTAGILAFVVFSDNSKGKLNRIYLAMTTSMMSWVTFAYVPRIVSDNYYNWGLLSLKVAWFVTPLFFMFLYLLSISLTDSEKKYKILTFFVILVGLIWAVISGFTDAVVADYQRIDQITSIIYGSLKIPFLIAITFITISILIPVFNIKNFFQDKKMRLFSFGLFIFLLLNVIFNITLPMFFGIAQLYFLGDYSTLILLACIAYAITRHKLFNIKVVVTEVISFFIWASIFIQFLSASTLNNRLLSGILLVFVAIFGILLIRSVKREINQKEKIEKMAVELEKAYVIEKKAKEEIEKIDKFKDQFLMVTQHNLRTPLTSMMGYSDLMLKGFFGKQNKKTTEVIQKFQGLTQGMIRMVNNFLDMAQFQLGKSVIMFKPDIDVEQLMGEIVQELQFKAESKGIYLKMEKPERKFLIAVDREKLKAAIFNVVDNAVKYTEKGGVGIKIQNHDTVKIIITDTGIGIAKEKLPGMFEQMFERSEEAKKVTSLGSGVGLYLSGQIIKAHKGKVWAESEGIGKGSTFHIELPMTNEVPVTENQSKQ